MIDPQMHQIITYIYVVFVESLGSHWIASVIPQIVENNFKTSNPEDRSNVAGQYFTYFMVGLIVGSLLWPSVVTYISKRNCILIGIFGQAFSNFMVGQVSSMKMILLWRFFFGFFHVINTIGKDFIYDFAHAKYRQFIFTLRSMAVMVASFFGPMIGYMIYYYHDKDFSLTLTTISIIMLSSFVLFLISFFIFPSEQKVIEHNPDELAPLQEHTGHHHGLEVHHQKSAQIGLIPILKFCWKKPELRNVMLGFICIFSIYNAQLLVAVFFVETPWNEQGFGLSDKEVSIIVLSVFLPVLIFFLISGLYVPKKVSEFAYTKVILIINMIWLLGLPALRDYLSTSSYDQRIHSIYGFVALSLVFNPNLVSPYLNYYMNNHVPKNGRTSFNSITFVSTAFFAILIFQTILPLYSISMYDPKFQAYAPYNKYICFLLMDVILILGAYFLREPKKHKH